MEEEKGLDGRAMEFLKCVGDSLRKWIRRIFTKCMVARRVPKDWQSSCIVPLRKGKGGASKVLMLQIIGRQVYEVCRKLHERIIVKKEVMKQTDLRTGQGRRNIKSEKVMGESSVCLKAKSTEVYREHEGFVCCICRSGERI